MPRFHYKAVGEDGQLVQGELQAPSHDAAIEWLQDHGHTPIRAVESGTEKAIPASTTAPRLPRPLQKRRKLDIGRFTRDLSTLLAAGVQLERALQILAEMAEDTNTAGLLSRLLDEIREGASLAGAMEAQQGVFSKFYLNMVRAGEAGGAVETVLGRLAVFMEQYHELKSSIKSALIYPSILITITVASVIILVVFVVPQFATLFEDMGQELPLPTRIVIGFGEAFQKYGLAVALLVSALIYLLRRQLAKPQFRYRWDKWLLGLPLLGELITKIEVTVFARTLGTLLSSGVPMLTALGIVKETHTNRLLREAVESIADNVEQGQGLAGPMLETGRFPRLASHLVQVGEETGQLEQTLNRLADIYDREVTTSIQRMLALVEPVLIIGLGIVVGGIIMSILVAVLSVNDLAF
ncbi:MAG TPA: type II secretion system F family protein [Gammaproteobacteria bacterium]|nr:type II secretion system F family protein [Gammaproteobacteria bacterium]